MRWSVNKTVDILSFINGAPGQTSVETNEHGSIIANILEPEIRLRRRDSGEMGQLPAVKGESGVRREGKVGAHRAGWEAGPVFFKGRLANRSFCLREGSEV